MEVGSIPCGWQVDSKDGTPMREPAHPPIAKDKVRYVGEIVAVIIAESLEDAKNAAELININYDLVVPIFFVMISILLISKLPTYSFKKIIVPRRMSIFLIFGVVIYFVLLLLYYI